MNSKDIDSKAIEEKAINEVKRYFEDSSVVATYINENDKEPFWDGHLYIYARGKRDKSHYSGRISVQVKGKVVSSFSNDMISYPIQTVDLKAYKREGVAFFVVQEMARNKQLFYRLLSPIELRSIIDNHTKQKTVGVTLERVEDNDIKRVEMELIDFLWDCRKQISFVDQKPLRYENLLAEGINTFRVSAALRSEESLGIQILTKRPVFIYAVINEYLSVPLGEGPAYLSLQRVIKEPVLVKGTCFFNEFDNQIKDGKVIISIGRCFKMTMETDNDEYNQKVTVNITRNIGLLKETIRDAEFLLALLDAKEITIGNTHIDIPFTDTQQQIDQIRWELNVWKKLDRTLENLGVNVDLDLTKISSKDESTINILIESILYGREVGIKNPFIGINNICLGNINLLLLIFEGKEKGKYSIRNLFDRTNGVQASFNYPEGTLLESIFSYFDRNKILNCDNIPFNNVIPSYEALKAVNPHIYERGNQFLLELIAAYDLSKLEKKKSILYAAALKISNWLLANDAEEKNVQNLINHYQILKRRPGLNEDDRQCIEQLLSDNSDKDEVAYCLALLLDYKETYLHHWEKLSKEQQSRFQKDFPIHIFHK